MDEQIDKLKDGVEKNTSKKGSIGWGILGFFIPIVGIILFAIWRKENKKASKAAGIGALIGAIVSVIFTVIYFVWLANFLFGNKRVINGNEDPNTKIEEKDIKVIDDKDEDKDKIEVFKTIEGKKPNGEKITVVYHAINYDVTLSINGKEINTTNLTLYVEGVNYNEEIKVTGYDDFAIIDLDTMDTCGPDTHTLIVTTYDGIVLFDTPGFEKKYNNGNTYAVYHFNGYYSYDQSTKTITVTYQNGAAGECSFPQYLDREDNETDAEYCSRVKQYKDISNNIIRTYTNLGSENLQKVDEKTTTISEDGYLSTYFDVCNY